MNAIAIQHRFRRFAWLFAFSVAISLLASPASAGNRTEGPLKLLDGISGPAGSDGVWSALIGGAAPPIRLNHLATIYDPIGDRLIVFGGNNGSGSFRNDTWSLSLNGSPTWTQLFPSGPLPPARSGCAAVYDPVRHRMVIWGGLRSGGFLADTWELSLAGGGTWLQLSPTGVIPPAGDECGSAYDAVLDRMIVFGGRRSSPFVHNETWQLSFSGGPTWSQLFPSASLPAPRYAHSIVHDPSRNVLILFGGYDGANYFQDTWELPLTGSLAWSQLSPAGTPPSSRYAMYGVYDNSRGRMVLFGGFGSTYFNDTWTLKGLGTSPEWTELLPTGTPPSPRTSYANIYDPVRDRLVLFGGYQNSVGAFNDTHFLTFSIPVAVTLSTFTAGWINDRVVIRWAVSESTDHLGFLLYRGSGAMRTQVTPAMLTGRTSYEVIDDSAPLGGESYWLVEVSRTGIETEYGPLELSSFLSEVSVLMNAAHPNPFTASTTISYRLPETGPVTVSVLDSQGRLVRTLTNAILSEGPHEASWDGTFESGLPAPGGMYFLRLQAQKQTRVRKILLAR